MADYYVCQNCGKKVHSAGTPAPSGQSVEPCPNKKDGTPHYPSTGRWQRQHSWKKV